MHALSSVAFPSVHTTPLSSRAARPSELSWFSPIILADEQRPWEGTELTQQHIARQPKARTSTKVSCVHRCLFPWQHNASLSTIQCSPLLLNLTVSHWTGLIPQGSNMIKNCPFPWGTHSLWGRERDWWHITLFLKLQDRYEHRHKNTVEEHLNHMLELRLKGLAGVSPGKKGEGAVQTREQHEPVPWAFLPAHFLVLLYWEAVWPSSWMQEPHFS